MCKQPNAESSESTTRASEGSPGETRVEAPESNCAQEPTEVHAGQNDSGHVPVYRERWLKRFAKRFEPYGILIAVCALGVALGTLWVEIDLRNKTLTALGEEKELREETLAALADEKELREATLLSMLLEHFELAHSKKYYGHIQIFERVARTKMDLRGLDASGLDFYSSAGEGGIILNNADLRYVDFKGSDLSFAQLANAKLNGANLRKAKLHEAKLGNADLTDANLRQANMYGADLSGAVLEKTNLRETDVSAVNFSNARGLEQEQLDVACADPEEDPPKDLPIDSRTGKQLVWRGEQCVE